MNNTRNKQRACVVAGFLLLSTGLMAGMMRQGGSVDPAEDAIKIASEAKASAVKQVGVDLILCSELIDKLPKFLTGKIPAFDSYWTPCQLSSKYGRPLTLDETQIVEELNALPYRVKTDPAMVGLTRTSVDPSAIVYRVTGTFNSSLILNASMNSAAIPTVNLVPDTP